MAVMTFNSPPIRHTFNAASWLTMQVYGSYHNHLISFFNLWITSTPPHPKCTWPLLLVLLLCHSLIILHAFPYKFKIMCYVFIYEKGKNISTFWPILGGAQTQKAYTWKWIHHLIAYIQGCFNCLIKENNLNVAINNANVIHTNLLVIIIHLHFTK